MKRRLIRLDVEDMVRALERVPLFDGCGEAALRAVAERSHVLSFEDGEVIVPEGEEGLGFYVVLSGSVLVRHGEEVAAALGPNDFFGEISLLEGEPRGASVVAGGHAVCLGILRSHFRPLLVRNPRLALRILEEEARRARAGEIVT